MDINRITHLINTIICGLTYLTAYSPEMIDNFKPHESKNYAFILG